MNRSVSTEKRRYPSQAAIDRAIKAARNAGIEVAGFRIEPNGGIVVFDKNAAPLDEFEKWQESRQH